MKKKLSFVLIQKLQCLYSVNDEELKILYFFELKMMYKFMVQIQQEMNLGNSRITIVYFFIQAYGRKIRCIEKYVFSRVREIGKNRLYEFEILEFQVYL